MKASITRILAALLVSLFLVPAFAAPDFPQGRRVVLCGEIHLENGDPVLRTDALPPIHILGLSAAEVSSQGTSGACVGGTDFPHQQATGEWEFPVKRAAFSPVVREALTSGWLSPVKACGPLLREEGELYLEYGLSPDRRASLELTPATESYRKGPLPSPSYCVRSGELPSRGSEGRWRLKAAEIENESRKSGFSVGNL